MSPLSHGLSVCPEFKISLTAELMWFCFSGNIPNGSVVGSSFFSGSHIPLKRYGYLTKPLVYKVVLKKRLAKNVVDFYKIEIL